MYFVMSCDADGTAIWSMTKESLLKYLDEFSGEILSTIPNSDPNYWGENKIVIIKGEIIIPKPVEVVTRYELE